MTSQTHSIRLFVNGSARVGTVEGRRRLADFLREDLCLTGTHLSCEQGVCGACTVIVDDKPTLSCLMFAVQANGKSVRTVEGLSSSKGLSVIQKAFREKHALQCGFCTPGFLMSLSQLFESDPSASDERIKEVIDGVLCRCTGYGNILEAAIAARDELKKQVAD